MQRIGLPGEPADARTTRVVEVQIGRPPRGEVAVSALCPFGLPAVVRTSPRLADGTPFPTIFYLTCPVAVRDIGRLEATGMMEEMREQLESDPELRRRYAEAHERYIRVRDSFERLDEPMSAGGMPDRVKCLHALYAHELGDSNPIGELVAERIEPIDCPGPCVADIGDGTLEAVPGHPGYRGRRKRR